MFSILLGPSTSYIIELLTYYSYRIFNSLSSQLKCKLHEIMDPTFLSPYIPRGMYPWDMLCSKCYVVSAHTCCLMNEEEEQKRKTICYSF